MAAEALFSAAALDDLFAIYVYIAEAAGTDIADAYDARLRQACLGLANFPRRGTPATIWARASAPCRSSGGR